MKMWLRAMTLNVVLTVGVALPFGAQAMGVVGGSAGRGVVHGPGFHHGFHHGFRVHSPFFSPLHPFHQRQPNFGAGFASRQSNVLAGGYGDSDDSYDDDYDNSYVDDSISNLHFRVQEPFGPGDIGRRPVPDEEDAPYMPERMEPGPGYEPDR